MAFSITRNVNAMPIIFDNNPAARIELANNAPHRWGTVKGVFDTMAQPTPYRNHGMHFYYGLTLDHMGNPLVVVCRMRDGSLKAYISSEYLARHQTHLDYIKHAIYKMGVKRGNWEEKTQVELMSMFTSALSVTMEDLLPEGQKATSKAFLMAETEALKPKPVVVPPTPTGASELADYRVVKLINPGSSKLAVVKLIKEITLLGLKECKELVDTSPSILFSGIPSRLAGEIQQKFAEVGAIVAVEEMFVPQVMGIKPKSTKSAKTQEGWSEFFKDLDSVNVPESVDSNAFISATTDYVSANILGTTVRMTNATQEEMVELRNRIDEMRAEQKQRPARPSDMIEALLSESSRNQQPPSRALTEEERILQDQLDAEIQSML